MAHVSSDSKKPLGRSGATFAAIINRKFKTGDTVIVTTLSGGRTHGRIQRIGDTELDVIGDDTDGLAPSGLLHFKYDEMGNIARPVVAAVATASPPVDPQTVVANAIASQFKPGDRVNVKSFLNDGDDDITGVIVAIHKKRLQVLSAKTADRSDGMWWFDYDKIITVTSTDPTADQKEKTPKKKPVAPRSLLATHPSRKITPGWIDPKGKLWTVSPEEYPLTTVIGRLTSNHYPVRLTIDDQKVINRCGKCADLSHHACNRCAMEADAPLVAAGGGGGGGGGDGGGASGRPRSRSKSPVRSESSAVREPRYDLRRALMAFQAGATATAAAAAAQIPRSRSASPASRARTRSRSRSRERRIQRRANEADERDIAAAAYYDGYSSDRVRKMTREEKEKVLGRVTNRFNGGPERLGERKEKEDRLKHLKLNSSRSDAAALCIIDTINGLDLQSCSSDVDLGGVESSIEDGFNQMETAIGSSSTAMADGFTRIEAALKESTAATKSQTAALVALCNAITKQKK